ncbi:MAG TPA: tetraacyldisaccharide 4'-kinase [Bacteroidia bacterium]|nr:tetraacyldisaccharide 4'-kinase [Bacteroidia bacterium]
MNFRLFLLPVSFVYASIADIRNYLFDKNIFTQKLFKKPVILVGNLSVGGTGKTPHVEYLVRLLHKEFRVATLSRGYGRNTTGFVLGGKGSNSSTIGDEPMQYLSKFDDVTVSVCEDRTEGAEKLFAMQPPPDVIIMDDGFQHRKINPGFKILLTPFDQMFTQDFVLPAGNLRERRSGYLRADCIIVTKCEENLGVEAKRKLISDLKPSSTQEVFFSSITYADLISLFSAESISLNELSHYDVVLFTGIENPKPLYDFLKKKSKSTTEIKFPDHHVFTEKDILKVKGIFDKFANGKTIILTTEKDYQRLKGTAVLSSLSGLPCFYIPVVIKIDRENEFNTIIKKYVAENKGNS